MVRLLCLSSAFSRSGLKVFREYKWLLDKHHSEKYYLEFSDVVSKVNWNLWIKVINLIFASRFSHLIMQFFHSANRWHSLPLLSSDSRHWSVATLWFPLRPRQRTSPPVRGVHSPLEWRTTQPPRSVKPQFITDYTGII